MPLTRTRQGGALNASQDVGFSLIEILVSMLLISLAFLNVAGLQTAAKKANYDALQRTSAVILANDIAEKMRANPISLDRYITAGNGVGGGTLNQPNRFCILATQCNPDQLGVYDMWLWEQALDGASETREISDIETNTGGLVSSTACITGPSAGAAGVYTITIVWRGLNELSDVSSKCQ